jgi:hypothetical protein
MLLIGQQSLGDFFRYRQQFNLLLSIKNNYSLLVISWNDKNKKLTLLSQRKLALTTRNTLFA